MLIVAVTCACILLLKALKRICIASVCGDASVFHVQTDA